MYKKRYLLPICITSFGGLGSKAGRGQGAGGLRGSREVHCSKPVFVALALAFVFRDSL